MNAEKSEIKFKLPVSLLFSFSQNSFHIEDVNETSARGMEALMLDLPSDWIVVGYFQCHEEASALIAQLPRPSPFPERLSKALAAEWDDRRWRFHRGEEGGD